MTYFCQLSPTTQSFQNRLKHFNQLWASHSKHEIGEGALQIQIVIAFCMTKTTSLNLCPRPKKKKKSQQWPRTNARWLWYRVLLNWAALGISQKIFSWEIVPFHRCLPVQWICFCFVSFCFKLMDEGYYHNATVRLFFLKVSHSVTTIWIEI